MVILLLASASFAEEVLVSFEPPASVPFPTRAGFVAASGQGADCRAASASALGALRAEAEARALPHVVRLLAGRAPGDLSIRAECRDAAGKGASGKTVDLLGLAVAGSDAPGWPTLPGDLAPNLIWAVSQLHGVPPDQVELPVIDGAPGLRFRYSEDLGSTALDVAGRAAYVLEQHVLPAAPAWVHAMAPFPQVAAYEIEERLRSRSATDKKERRDETFRVVVRATDARAFATGSLTEQQLAARRPVLYRPLPTADVEVPVVLDLDAIERPPEETVEFEDRDLDVSDEDVQGLTDE